MKRNIKRIIILLSSILLLSTFPAIPVLAAGDVTVIDTPTVFSQIRSIEMAHDGGFYVSDSLFDRIKKYTANGELDTTFVTDGILGESEGYNDVSSICLDNDGNIYVGDRGNKRVIKYNKDGQKDTSFGVNGILTVANDVYGVALGNDGGVEYLYISQKDNSSPYDESGVTRYHTKKDAGNSINSGDKDTSFDIAPPTSNHFTTRIAVDQHDNLYVSVCNFSDLDKTMEIRKYNSSGTFQLSIGKGVLTQPYGLHIDTSDRIYVADRSNHCIRRYTSTGVADTTFASNGILDTLDTAGSTPQLFSSPIDLFVNETTGYLYIADSVNRRIKKYKLSDLTLDTSFDGNGILGGTRGTETNQMSNINDIALCPGGGYVVSDSGNDRIKKYTSTGALDTSFGNGGILTQLNGSAFDNIYQVTVDNSGNIYVADSNADKIKICTSTGAFIRDITNAKIQSPKGVAVDNAGNIFVGDSGSDEVIKFNSTGSTILWSKPVSDPYSIALDIDGTSIYVASAGSDNVQKFDTNGNLIASFSGDGILEDGFSNPRGITVDNDGNIFVSDATLDIVKKYDSNGNLDTSFDSDGIYSRSRMAGDDFIDSPYGMMVKDNNLYIADRTNSRIVIW